MSPEDPLSSAVLNQAEKEALSKIIKALNDRSGTDFTEEDQVVIRQLEEHLAGIPMLEQSVRVNTPENAMLTFKEVPVFS